MQHDTVVLIPAYCPDEKLIKLLDELSGDYELCVVNDGSGSGYDEIFRIAESKCILLGYGENRGKGYALKYGFSHIEKLFPKARYVITADADGQHTALDIAAVEKALADQAADGMVLGARKFSGNVPLRSAFGNSITRKVFSLASGRKLSDTQSGLRGFSVSLMNRLCSIEGDRYEYEMNMLLRLCEDKTPITEVEIETVYIDGNSSSHFRPIKDSLRVYKVIFLGSQAMRFVVCSIVGFAVYYILTLILHSVLSFSDFAMELSSTAAWLASSQANFWLVRRFAFRSHGNAVREMGGYYALAVVNYFVKVYALQELLYRVLSLPLWLVLLISEAVMYVVNYVFEKKLIFGRKSK